MSFQQGLSGLNASAKHLDVIGNNVANSNTVGFKQSQALFADMYATSLAGADTVRVGTGVKISNVAQQFTQGNITNTSNSMDIAISGQGFFRMEDQNGAISYSRNGQFQLDKNGFIVNSQGHRLSGYMATNGIINTAQPVPLQIVASDLTPNPTANVKVGLNLDSRMAVPAITPFNPNDPQTYNSSTSLTLYDSLGSSHVASLYFAKTAANTWDAYLTVDGAQVPLAGTPLATLSFNTSGQLTTPMPVVSAAFTPTGAGAQTLTFDFTGTSQFGGNFGVNAMTQDGFASGRLSGFTTGQDGIILGRYTNGQSRTLAQVVLANFTNPQGLQPLGNNAWAETASSGGPLVGIPGSSSLGVLQSSAVEDSNVDLTAELVNMITAQRVYQANAQTIKAQDQVLQTLVNLR